MLILYFGVYDNNSNIDNEELMIFIVMNHCFIVLLRAVVDEINFYWSPELVYQD